MKTTKEQIKMDSPDWWECVCGNTPDSDGFYTCDEFGNEVEPTETAWKTNNYVCARCKRFFDCQELVVLGLNEDARILGGDYTNTGSTPDERMEGLANIKAEKSIEDAVKTIAGDLISDGFEADEVTNYLTKMVAKKIKKAVA